MEGSLSNGWAHAIPLGLDDVIVDLLDKYLMRIYRGYLMKFRMNQMCGILVEF